MMQRQHMDNENHEFYKKRIYYDGIFINLNKARIRKIVPPSSGFKGSPKKSLCLLLLFIVAIKFKTLCTAML